MSSSKGTALITGASSGIGAAYADRLAARGHHLILVARRRDRLEEQAARLHTAYGSKVEIFPADLAKEEDLGRVEALFTSTREIDMLVNSAGLGALGPGAAVDPKMVDGLVRVNVLALTRLSLVAARAFAQRKQGTIINIGSILALMPGPGASSYSASKAYVLNFSRSLQAELGQSGVTVQAVMPSMVHSEFFGDRPAPFPEHLFMSAETLVDTALRALDQGELITFPTLHDVTQWQEFDNARISLVKALTQGGQPAARYNQSNV